MAGRERSTLSPEKRRLVELRLRGLGARAKTIPRRAAGTSGPLALAQEPFWVSERLAPGSGAYAVAGAWRLRGALDAGLLAGAVDELALRHEVLRTVFTSVDGVPLQVVQAGAEVPFVQLDLRAEPDPEEAALAWLAEAGQAFDLGRRPPWRVALLRVAEDEQLLILCSHHIVCDAWSMDLVLAELDELYRSRRDGREPRLSPLPLQYLDFALWQRDRLDERGLAAELAYWRERLAGAPAATQLPFDRPRPARRSDSAGSIPFTLADDLVAGLRELAAEKSSGLFATCLAGLACVLARYGGERELVVGVPVAGRTAVELEELVGCFINMLALRIDLSGRPTFRELVDRVRATTLEALAHQELPFARLVQELRPARDPRFAPIFQVVFAHDMPTAGYATFADLPAAPVTLRTPRGTDFDLVVTQSEGPDGVGGEWDYAEDVFDASTVEQLGAGYRRLLAAAVRDPDRPIGGLPLLDPEERARVLRWGSGRSEAQPAETVLAAIGAALERFGPAPAVAGPGGVITYRELESWSSRIAVRLEAAGVGLDDRVAVVYERTASAAAVAGLLGVVRAGAAAVPVDAGRAPEQIGATLARAAVAAAVCESELAPLLPPDGPPVARADVDGPETGVAPRREVHPASLACVIDQPESTLLVEQRTLAGLVLAVRDGLGVAPSDHVLDLTSLSSVASLATAYGALAAGATLVVSGDGEVPEGREQPAVRLFGPAGALEALVDDSAPGAAGATASPLPGVRAYVVDAQLQPVAVGVPGELLLGGLGVARGFTAPAETAASFVPDALGTQPGGRLYRTGERVKWTPTGELRFLAPANGQAAAATASATRLAPRTDRERDVAEICAELLGGPEIGVRDDFFELGGHSLLLMRVLSRIYERCGVEIPYAAVIQEPTVENIAAAVDVERLAADRAQPLATVTPDVEALVAGLSDEDADLLLRQLLG